MEEVIINGIVVGAEDYKEADKLLRIYSPELGLVRAVAKGVKKEKAKLKFCAMPFSFCEYSLMARSGYYTVKTASQIESLMGVTRTPQSYICASVILECSAFSEGQNPSDIFLSMLSALKNLIYSEVSAYAVCLNFVYSLLNNGGYVSPTERDEPYNVAVDEQKNFAEEGVMLSTLKKYVKIFETKLCCKIKSAELL